jgi:hypothetical protein
MDQHAAAPAASLWNFRLLVHHTLNGFGGMGEGLSIQIAPDGRRILWAAHESAPKNFTGIDMTEPRSPRVDVQIELPKCFMRSNSLDGSATCWPSPTRRSSPARRPRVSNCSTCHVQRRRARSPSSTPSARIPAVSASSGSATGSPST